MEIFGMNITPTQTSLQSLAVATWFFIITAGCVIGVLLSTYLLFYSKFWLLTLVYLIWIWVIDRNCCEKGGRRIERVQRWIWWTYFKEYFPLKLERVAGVELDPKRNYLFCCFPHGILPVGGFFTFSTYVSGFSNFFPHHRPVPIAISLILQAPFLRDFILSLGGCSASAKSIDYLLSRPEGGIAVGLAVGGAAEAFNCRPGEYRFILKKRKGFVKLALKNGAPLVPTISFGETDLFDQVSNPKGSFLRKVQEALKRVVGFAPVIPRGGGIFGLVPLRKPVTVVVGKPLDLEKIEDPTMEEIEAVHEKFVNCLTELFEEQKHNYLKDPDSTFLIIE